MLGIIADRFLLVKQENFAGNYLMCAAGAGCSHRNGLCGLWQHRSYSTFGCGCGEATTATRYAPFFRFLSIWAGAAIKVLEETSGGKITYL
jgi:hypothetical protein